MRLFYRFLKNYRYYLYFLSAKLLLFIYEITVLIEGVFDLTKKEVMIILIIGLIGLIHFYYLYLQIIVGLTLSAMPAYIIGLFR